MAREKKQEEQEQGAPEWMVTFSDCMTLLLTFFVLLLSFSSFEKKTFPTLAESFGKAIPTITFQQSATNKSNLIKRQKNRQTTQDKGSSTPTEVGKKTKNTMRETNPKNFRTLRVFTAASNEIFISRGKALSPQGKKVIKLMAQFLKKIPSRVIISETGTTRAVKNPFLGLPRAYQAMKYLSKSGIKEDYLSISASNTLHQNTKLQIKGRQLQITLLERDLYEP